MEGLEAILTQFAGQAAKLALAEARIAALESVGDEVRKLSGQLADLQLKAELGSEEEGRAGHKPWPTPRWHELKDDKERAASLNRARAIVDQVFRPLLGHYGKQIGACWEQHPLSCITIEVASELYRYLFLSDRRSPAILSGQADYLGRVLPALLAIVHKDCGTCAEHAARPDLAKLRAVSS